MCALQWPPGDRVACLVLKLGHMRKRSDTVKSVEVKTAAQRQADLRARRSGLGLKEVRNLYAYPEDHERIKKYVARLVKERTGV